MLVIRTSKTVQCEVELRNSLLDQKCSREQNVCITTRDWLERLVILPTVMINITKALIETKYHRIYCKIDARLVLFLYD